MAKTPLARTSSKANLAKPPKALNRSSSKEPPHQSVSTTVIDNDPPSLSPPTASNVNTAATLMEIEAQFPTTLPADTSTTTDLEQAPTAPKHLASLGPCTRLSTLSISPASVSTKPTSVAPTIVHVETDLTMDSALAASSSSPSTAPTTNAQPEMIANLTAAVTTSPPTPPVNSSSQLPSTTKQLLPITIVPWPHTKTNFISICTLRQRHSHQT